MRSGASLHGLRFRAASAVLVMLCTSECGWAQFADGSFANYNWTVPHGSMNYNYDFMRYGLPGLGPSPFNPMTQAQLNMDMLVARNQMMGGWGAGGYASANLANQQAIAQQLANQQRMQQMNQVMEPRYQVRKRTSRSNTRNRAQRTTPEPLPRDQVLGPDATVLWPKDAPTDQMLGELRTAADDAIKHTVKDFEANGKASIQSVVEAKERLAAYGQPALKKLTDTNLEGARNLLRFLASLEHIVNTQAGL